MIIHEIKDFSNTMIICRLKEVFSEITDTNYVKNYNPAYENDPGNFFYILKAGRYQLGNYYVLFDDNDNYCASAGWNPHDQDKNVALALTRAYIVKKYRSNYLLSTYFLPKILKETSGYKKLWITCNEYNKVIYSGISRMNNFGRGSRPPWPNIYSNFVPIGEKLVNNVNQYVLEMDLSNEYCANR